MAASYREQWDDLRRRYRLAIVGFLLFPLIPVVGWALQGRPGGSRILLAFALGSMLLTVIASFRAGFFRCPRCREWFFLDGPYRNSFTRKCLRCGLPKWADQG
ncbi:hypothetical protein COCOR_00146 [Corallococcus coralloides DSM 2259]|uniref:Uncharacterized protein n=1 Tax=Corallococcus coralloides (strain ATCC 25202 / DSM 2259 / NBRC 100086 / M2) TaxID=1144275 RepID=H8MV12_CORCM|nr:hypothetical protein COCOR_00146 [Corallococcus coralloides DSM 2259]